MTPQTMTSARWHKSFLGGWISIETGRETTTTIDIIQNMQAQRMITADQVDIRKVVDELQEASVLLNDLACALELWHEGEPIR